jgi:hypothetical protein
MLLSALTNFKKPMISSTTRPTAPSIFLNSWGQHPPSRFIQPPTTLLTDLQTCNKKRFMMIISFTANKNNQEILKARLGVIKNPISITVPQKLIKKNLFACTKEEHIQEGVNLCTNSLIGKILSNKPILKSILQHSLQGIWGNPAGFTINEIEGGYFRINLELNADIQRILKGNPWIIRNSWFMVHLWDRQINPSNLDFHHVPTWIQIWGLPIHCKTVNMGKHLGAQLGKVEDAALYDYPQKARIIKIKVSLDIREPIRPGMFIGNTKDDINWVDFRYENLPMFCFGCGLVGHTEDNCSDSSQNSLEERVNTRGSWLRSNIYGKRVNENRDKRFNSNPMQSTSGGQFSPIPKSMLAIFAKLKLEEDLAQQNRQQEDTQQNFDSGRSSSTQLHQQSLTPVKRKFLRSQGVFQVTNGSSSPSPSKITKASLVDLASQDQ